MLVMVLHVGDTKINEMQLEPNIFTYYPLVILLHINNTGRYKT